MSTAIAQPPIALTPRLRRLIEERKERWRAQKPSWKAYEPKLVDGKPPIVNKSQAFTEAYRAAEGQAPILRAALAFRAECETIPIHIDDDEIIVGYYIRGIASFRYGQGLYAEPWFNRAGWTDEELEQAERTLAFWDDNTCGDAFRRIDQQGDWALDHEVRDGGGFGGHNVIEFNRLIQLGLPGLRDEIESHALRNATDEESRDFYEAMRVTCDAIAIADQRHGEEAKRQSEICSCPSRRDELEQIAKVCQRVATNKPETLHEAAQLFHLAHMLDGFEDYGRLDQDLLPYYRADLENGRLTIDEASDILGAMAARVMEQLIDALEAVPCVCGGHCVATPTVGMGIGMGHDSIASATPDGRRKNDRVVDSVGPAHGRDRNGPTAMLNSVAKLDMSRAVCGATLNLRFHPSMVSGQNGPDTLVNLLKGYFDRGGYNAQIQVVDDKTLLAAQQDPETHRDLVVRVAGYNAVFVDLSETIQNDIIARTAHM